MAVRREVPVSAEKLSPRLRRVRLRCTDAAAQAGGGRADALAHAARSRHPWYEHNTRDNQRRAEAAAGSHSFLLVTCDTPQGTFHAP